MNTYNHHVSGFFAHRKDADQASTSLVDAGIPSSQIQIFQSGEAASPTAVRSENDEVLTDMLVDGGIGTVVGAGIGALVEVALVAGSVSLFVASPLIAPLVLMGWGASLGGFVGAWTGSTAGTEKKEGWLSDLVGDAIENGQVVLVAEARSETEAVIERDIINAAIGDYKDTEMPFIDINGGMISPALWP